MRFEGVRDLTIGMFRIRSGVIRGTTVEGGEIRQPASDMPARGRPASPASPRLLVSGPGAGPGRRQAADLRADHAGDAARPGHRL